IGTLFSGLIVAVCCGLYVSSYPKSPEATSLSPLACGTLAFSILSSLVTFIFILRQKSGRTQRAIFESAWIIFAIAMWILAAVGGIARPPNGMSNISCKVLPSGKETSDPNYLRACQSMFASTAFCIITAFFFIAIALMLFVFSVKTSRKSKKNQVGGHYKLSLTLSQYRRAEKEAAEEESRKLKGAGEHEEEVEEEHGPGSMMDGHFSGNVYRDPVISTPAATLHYPNPYSEAELHMQQQQQQHHHQQQLQYQQQQSTWAQQPATFGPY
ncbi:hypothetical protein BGZ54_002792, partial [Gamsiella multidivaricata]